MLDKTLDNEKQDSIRGTYYDRNKLQPFRGDIFIADLSGISLERKDRRPVIILSNNIGNKYCSNVIVATCSSKAPSQPTHASINLQVPTCVMTERIHTIPRDNLVSFIRRTREGEMAEVDEKIKISLGLVAIESNKPNMLKETN